MEDKKVLNNEELEKVTGGFDNYWHSLFYCEKCRQPYNIGGLIDTYRCPDCGAELQCTGQKYGGECAPESGL